MQLQLVSGINIQGIQHESILKVTGVVIPRPPKMQNPKMATGAIEVQVSAIELLNSSKAALPMQVTTFNRAKETLRMEYRYIDLRFSDMQRNLRTRSQVLMKMRDYLVNYAGFVDVETPTLFRRTPGVSLSAIVDITKKNNNNRIILCTEYYSNVNV